MPTARELLVYLLMTAPAIRGGQANTRDHKPVMIFLVLSRRGLVALQAVDAFLCVLAHFVLMHDRILQARVTLRALARRSHEVGSGLLGLDFGPRPVNEETA